MDLSVKRSSIDCSPDNAGSHMLHVEIKDGNAARPLVDPFYKSVDKAHRAKDTDIFFILFENEKVIGTVRHCFEEGVSMLKSMNVHPDFRGRHLGLRLLEAFEMFLIQNNITESYCIPYGHLTRFYGLIGYEPISENEAPTLLRDRTMAYRAQFPDKTFSIMCRRKRDTL